MAPKSASGQSPALVFVDGQYLFRWWEDGRESTKFISPADARAAFSQEAIDTGWMPPNARRWGVGPRGPWMVLFFPQTIHRLTVEAPEEFGQGNMELDTPLPAMLFAGCGHDYYVWAVKEDELRPNAAAFHAPLPNLYEDGRACFGANHAPLASSKTVEQARQTFFQGAFNGHLAHAKSRQHADDVRRQLLKLAGRRARRYPLADLMPFTATVDQLVKRNLIKDETYR